MRKQEILDRQAFEDRIRNESANTGLPYSARVHAAQLLMRHARTYSRIQEAVCNGVEWLTYDTNESFGKRQDRHEKWCEKRDQQLEKRIRAIASGLGFGVIFDGDPRGCTVKLTVPSGYTNDWGKAGLCVPGA